MFNYKQKTLLYLQVSVHDAHIVQVVDCIQNLSNEATGVHLRVEAFLYDAVEQLASRHPVSTRDRFISYNILLTGMTIVILLFE